MPSPPKDIKPLLRYFANLFKLQVTGTSNAPDQVRVIPVAEKKSGESIYELKIRFRSAWKSRRMSIQPLGEKVESKSTCYKVIYDDLLVVKIPPRPITDFQDYLKHINREHAIVRRIEKTIPCVYPQVSAILKKIPLVRLPSYILPEDAEKEYINILSKDVHLQDFLKIGDGFVFFMTLSQYFFFNQIIDAIHNTAGQARKEIVKSGPEAISDFFVFESLYGAENDQIYFDMHALDKAFENRVDDILRKADASWAITDDQKKEWFYSGIAGYRPDIDADIDADNLHKDAYEQIEEMIDHLIESKKPVVEKFRKVVYKASRNRNFSGHRQRIKGLVINILMLLHRVKKRQVAIRDLKPDNMYVAVYLEGADHILANPDAYDMGLIDLETALCFEPDKKGRVYQPLLAGTPSYATPSHIFGNKILRAYYKDDLPKIFYLQDMHAGLAMIFKVVTGRTLFIKTSQLIPEISRLKKKHAQEVEGLKALYKDANRRFWQSAKAELFEKTEKNRYRLGDIDIELSGRLKNFLAAEYKHEFKRRGCAGDKKKEKQYRDTLKAIDAPVTCDFLIEFMFKRVFYTMYKSLD